MNGNTDEWIVKLNEKIDQLTKRVNKLEVLYDNMRVQLDSHEHPPRYGGIFGG